MTRRGAQRLLALVLALALVSVAPTIAASLLTGRSQAPPVWSAVVCLAYAVVFVLLLVQAVRRATCWVPAWALVVVGNAVLATYPLVVTGAGGEAGRQAPWVLALSPLTVGAGAVALPSPPRALALTAVHLALRAVLQLEGTWVVSPDTAALDAVGLLVIATAASVAVMAVHGAAAQVEAARVGAERAAAAAAAARAVELENSRWDGIVHDDVLAALSMTAHARDRAERLRARAAAGRALTSIERDPDGDQGPVPLAEVTSRLAGTVLALHPEAAVTTPDDTSGTAGGLPGHAVDALVAATAEAVRNAVQHGGPPGEGPPSLRVRIRTGPGPGGAGRLSVEVRDDGVGFDTRRTGPRLGLAVSVRRRADVVGGRALVRSVPGVGTVVLLSIPLADPEAATDVASGRGTA
ncbi:ATP-binding protein [Kineococcus sp. SYSU DK003]|uniref:ATP-binding protein n=1 Tax=Kineococcus sp. SYSU DK003 TaxID=3383124 RepID=UPI003D7D1888